MDPKLLKILDGTYNLSRGERASVDCVSANIKVP